jgi:hypothetical protein
MGMLTYNVKATHFVSPWKTCGTLVSPNGEHSWPVCISEFPASLDEVDHQAILNSLYRWSLITTSDPVLKLESTLKVSVP